MPPPKNEMRNGVRQMIMGCPKGNYPPPPHSHGPVSRAAGAAISDPFQGPLLPMLDCGVIANNSPEPGLPRGKDSIP